MEFKVDGKIRHNYKIENETKGRQLVIPDIHGCAKTFKALLGKVELQKNDYLFLLGDYINRGPNNVEVLQTIFNLLKSDYRIYPLRGNHEQMALDSHNNQINSPDSKYIPSLQSRKGLLGDKKLLLPAYYRFFNSLPYFYELNDYLISHAGFNFSSPMPFEDFKSMLWAKKVRFVPEELDKVIIRGHITQTLTEVQESINNQDQVLTLDNGCYKKTTEGKGNLLCYNLNTRELVIQKNIE